MRNIALETIKRMSEERKELVNRELPRFGDTIALFSECCEFFKY